MKSIKAWIWLNIQWPIKEFFLRVFNLIRWFPIIWKDKDWDDWYIFNILQTKLKHQAEYIGKKDRHTRAQYDAQRMMTCVRLIDKIKEESYAGEYMEFHDLKFSSTKIENTNSYQMNVTTIRECFNDYFLMYPSDYKRVVVKGEGRLDVSKAVDETDRKERIASNMSHNRQTRAQRLLFQLLDKHIQGWWD